MFTLLKSVTALMKALGWINKTLCEAQMNFTRTLYEAEAFFFENLLDMEHLIII